MLYKKRGSIPLSRATREAEMSKHALRMKDHRLPKIVLFGYPSKAKQKAGRPRMGLTGGRKKGFKANWNFFGQGKARSFEYIGMESVCNFVGLRWLGAVMNL